jgi:hypothetical protein
MSPLKNLNQKDLDDYKDWRVEKICAKEKRTATKAGKKYLPNPKTGLRTVDLDLNCLCNAMNWSVRKTVLSTNSIAARARYYSSSDAIHCRDYSVASADELNTVAGALMSSRRSECLGWQVLIEGATGLRSEETVALRMDARQDEPGGLTPDGGSLCVRRAKKSEKHNIYVQVHEGLRLVLEAHKIWHEHRYPLSPWYLPGRDRKKLAHIDKGGLTKALGRLHRVYVNFRKDEKDPKKFPSQPYLARKYTSHGVGRAFYVLMRRSQGIQDRQIAYELNQIGGVSTLEQVYGLPPEHWKNGNAPKLSWIPKGEPAWAKIKGINFSKLASNSVHATTYEI